MRSSRRWPSITSPTHARRTCSRACARGSRRAGSSSTPSRSPARRRGSKRCTASAMSARRVRSARPMRSGRSRSKPRSTTAAQLSSSTSNGSVRQASRMPTASSRTTGSPSSSRAPEIPPALRALGEAGWALARRAPWGRIGRAPAAPVFDFIDYEPPIEPLDRTVVQRVARRLDELHPEPIAVRAAAQTHRGTADGEPVAVRILRPGLERAVRNDLALLDALAIPLAAALPRADGGALLRSVREQVLDDLDFEHEASMHRRVARVLRDVDGLVVPRVHTDSCTEDVFVADLLDGRTLADGARPKDPVAAARVLVTAHATAARAGLVLLDPRPGHVVFLADGRIGLLGIGQARPVDRERAGRALDALTALRD